MIKILHCITGLKTGGAENMLYKLLARTDREKFEPIVVSLTGEGTFGRRIKKLDIPVYTLGMNGLVNCFSVVWQLAKIIKSTRPDILQGWMYHANFVLGIMRQVFGVKTPVLWNVRHSLHNIQKEKRSLCIIIYLSTRLSKYASGIIYNSATAAQQHEAEGFAKEKRIIIPNGFDIEQFSPDPDDRKIMRDELGIPQDAIVIGMVARFHPMKAHKVFLEAASGLSKIVDNVRFILIGCDVDEKNQQLVDDINNRDLSGHVMLLGERMDVDRLMRAFDLATLTSSWGEAFPNVLGEAMASGIPCVSTDVGSVTELIGDSGIVVPRNDVRSLIEAWHSMISDKTILNEKGKQAQHQINEKYRIETIVDQYEKTYTETL